MELKIIDCSFSVCKVKDMTEIDFSDEFVFFSKTDEELSLVCSTERVPENSIISEDGWKGIRVQGELDFALIGILSKLSTILADHGISIFAISTYNTDYILLKEKQLLQAIEVLKKNGYEVIS